MKNVRHEHHRPHRQAADKSLEVTLEPIRTFPKHILEQQGKHRHATGEFSWVLAGIELATRIIDSQIRRGGTADIYGDTGRRNVHGENVQKLDAFAHEVIMKCLGHHGNVGIIASEEDDEPRIIKEPGESDGYIVLFDPLDGSSNIDVNISVGTIFSILERKADVDRGDVMAQILQPGYKQIAAGYVIYGSSTVLTYTTGDGVHMFTLDPAIGTYILTKENIRMPGTGLIYSTNQAYISMYPANVKAYLEWLGTEEAGDRTLRYVGSLVADFHRTLLRGGIFLYPATTKAPSGKLRLLYEANPIAFIAEQAGGMATDGERRIMNKEPLMLHERTPLIVGSKREVERLLSFQAYG